MAELHVGSRLVEHSWQSGFSSLTGYAQSLPLKLFLVFVPRVDLDEDRLDASG